MSEFMWYYAETDEWAPLNEKQYEILKSQAHAYARLRIAMRDIHDDFMKDIEAAKTKFPAINMMAGASQFCQPLLGPLKPLDPLAHEQTK